MFTEEVLKYLLEICEQIEELYEMYFLEIGSDDDHVHFLI
ncbi:MAG: transposase [Candidatus Peribacteria bacterium]|nr:transposase [Candidatus Peribacteria bacterium]